MQCSNCQFENMPGVKACGRCGANLGLGTLVIDVHPPRAGRVIKRWRRWVPVTRIWNRVRGQAKGPADSNGGYVPEPSDLKVLLRAIVPGWPQRRLGRMRRAKWFFWSYLALLLFGLLLFGTNWGGILLGLAFALHTAATIDVVSATFADFSTRAVCTFATVAILIVAIYLPAGWLLLRVATPVQFAIDAPPFAAGDVVLTNPSAYLTSDPQPGDVVVFRIQLEALQLQLHGERGHFYLPQGDHVDRIIARAGQTVTTRPGELLVNGAPSPWQPLNAAPVPAGLKIAVPQGKYLIFNTADAFAGQYPRQVWTTLSLVPRTQIVSRVYLRLQPLSRFSVIR